jgi:hypothetical protein
MNTPDEEAARQLEILGKRLRDGVGQQHPISDEAWKHIEDAVIEQFAKEAGKSIKEVREQLKTEEQASDLPRRAPKREDEEE